MLVVVLLWLVVVAGAAGSAVDAVLDGPAGRRGPLLRQGRELDGDGQAVDAVLAQARILVRALVRLVVLREQTRLGGQRGAREEALRLLWRLVGEILWPLRLVHLREVLLGSAGPGGHAEAAASVQAASRLAFLTVLRLVVVVVAAHRSICGKD